MVTHSLRARDIATNAVLALIGEFGNFVLRTDGTVTTPGAAVATLRFGKEAFGPSSGGSALANQMEFDFNAAGHAMPVATATIEAFDGTIVIHCSVAKKRGDINTNNDTLVIEPGDTVTCDKFTYTALKS